MVSFQFTTSETVSIFAVMGLLASIIGVMVTNNPKMVLVCVLLIVKFVVAFIISFIVMIKNKKR